MRKVCLLFGVVLIINTGHADALKVMTYNLLGMKPGTEPEIRIVHMIDYLIEIDPDIIGLQEINQPLVNGSADNQAKVIADSLGAYFGIPYYTYMQFTHPSWDNKFYEYIGIITKHPVEEQGFYQLATGVFPRKVVWNKINTPLGTIHVFNTHLSFNSSDVRIQQVQQIIAYIDSIELNHPAIASILTGDLNDTPNATSIQQLTNTSTESFYMMTYATANPGIPGYTAPSDAPTAKIDYIFLKNNSSLTPVESVIAMNQPYNDNNFCSDHLAVLTTFINGGTNVDASAVYPDEYQFFQNYPNPFNMSTTIQYRIPSAEVIQNTIVQFKVFDVLGTEVVSFDIKEIKTGINKVEFIGNELPSGIYICRLQAGEYNQSIKLILLK